MRKIKSLILIMLMTSLCALSITEPALADTPAILASNMNLELAENEATAETKSEDGAYIISIAEPESEESFVYGFQRQKSNWSGKHGLAIELSNISDGVTGISIQIMDNDWETITLREGQAVLIEHSDKEYMNIIYVKNGIISLPAGFSGRIYLPFIDLVDSEQLQVLADNVLSNIQGFGLTFAPKMEATVSINAIDFSTAEISEIFDKLSSTSIEIEDNYIVIPQTGETMTKVTVSGLEDSELEYSLLGEPAGVSIDDEGYIIVDPTATEGMVDIKVIIDGYLALEEELELKDVWDVKPENMPIEQYTILDTSHYSSAANYGFFQIVHDYVFPLQMFAAGVVSLIFSAYYIWHLSGKKRK